MLNQDKLCVVNIAGFLRFYIVFTAPRRRQRLIVVDNISHLRQNPNSGLFLFFFFFLIKKFCCSPRLASSISVRRARSPTRILPPALRSHLGIGPFLAIAPLPPKFLHARLYTIPYKASLEL